MEIILLENVEKLGAVGQVVNVKNGFARNFLIPKGKALLATKGNKEYFESQKAVIQKENDVKAAKAEKDAKEIDGKFFVLIRQASEDGRLYGSVSARDISRAITESTKVEIDKNTISLEKPIKEVGAFETKVKLHAGISSVVYTIVARSEDEAKETEKEFKNPVKEEVASEENSDSNEQKATQESSEGEAA